MDSIMTLLLLKTRKFLAEPFKFGRFNNPSFLLINSILKLFSYRLSMESGIVKYRISEIVLVLNTAENKPDVL